MTGNCGSLSLTSWFDWPELDKFVTGSRSEAHSCYATQSSHAPRSLSLRNYDRAFCEAKIEPNRFVRVGAGALMSKGAVYTPETVKLLRDALEDAWAALRPDERARASKTMLAIRLLEVAAAGERDPARLRSEALSTVVTSAL